MSATEDAERIGRNECPVCCNGPRKGTVNGRRALQSHIKISTDPAHVMWKENHYATHFKHGGNKIPVTITEQDVIKAIRSAFGNEWASRVSITI